tara:strand:- start:660 stop:1286 length:627 start_codon:yes stop_codon:yes gene_type:complete
MKKILLNFVLLVFLIACTDNKIEQQIQKAVSMENSNPPKMKAFSNVGNLKETLTDNSALVFSQWRKLQIADGSEKWTAHTPITRLGKNSIKNGSQNDIGYTILGAEENYVNEVQLNLNINNAEEKQEAFFHLAIFAEQTLASLNIEQPSDLRAKILNDENYFFENDSYYILLKKDEWAQKNYNRSHILELELDKSIAIETTRLIIKSK